MDNARNSTFTVIIFYTSMMICVSCGKHPHKIAYSRHQKGSSGASQWPLRAKVVKHTQHPNLHVFKGSKYCTKCLRMAKAVFQSKMSDAKPSTTKAVQA